MLFSFAVYGSAKNGGSPDLIHQVVEECAIHDVARRASMFLWIAAFASRQDRVVVHDHEGGHEVYRRSLLSPRFAGAHHVSDRGA